MSIIVVAGVAALESASGVAAAGCEAAAALEVDLFANDPAGLHRNLNLIDYALDRHTVVCLMSADIDETCRSGQLKYLQKMVPPKGHRAVIV